MEHAGEEGPQHLFAFPLESNLWGVRYDQGLVEAVQQGRFELEGEQGVSGGGVNEGRVGHCAGIRAGLQCQAHTPECTGRCANKDRG